MGNTGSSKSAHGSLHAASIVLMSMPYLKDDEERVRKLQEMLETMDQADTHEFVRNLLNSKDPQQTCRDYLDGTAYDSISSQKKAKSRVLAGKKSTFAKAA